MKAGKGTIGRFLWRLCRYIYHLISASFVGRFFASYGACNAVVKGQRRKEKKRSRTRAARRYTVRRALACAMEQNLLSRALRRMLTALTLCSLRTYGFFFTVAGAIWVSLYGVSLFVPLGSAIGWVHLVSGAISLLVGILLLFSDRSLGATLRQHSLVGALMLRVLGVPDDLIKEARERGTQHYLFASLLAFLVSALGLLASPPSLLMIAICLLLAMNVLSVPEAGLILALFFLPFSKLLVGSDVLTFAFLALSIIGYVGKLLRGNRFLRVELQDIPVLLMIVSFFLSGYSVATDVWGAAFFSLLLALSYLVAANAMSTPKWFAVGRTTLLVCASLASLVGIGQLLSALLLREETATLDIASLGKHVTAGFSDHVAFAYFLVIAFAFLLPAIPMSRKRTRPTLLAAALLISGTAVLTFTSAAWLSLAIITVAFFLVFECRSLVFLLLGGGTVTGALLLLPDKVKSSFFSIFYDLSSPVYQASNAEGGRVVSQILFGRGEVYRHGALRLIFGAGQNGLLTLHPLFSSAEPFSYSAYHLWQILLVDHGILGVAAVGAFFLILLQNCFSVLALSQAHERPLFAFIGICLVSALVLFGFFAYTWHDPATLASFFLSTALVAAAMRYYCHRLEKLPEADEDTRPAAEAEYRVRAPRGQKGGNI